MDPGRFSDRKESGWVSTSSLFRAKSRHFRRPRRAPAFSPRRGGNAPARRWGTQCVKCRCFACGPRFALATGMVRPMLTAALLLGSLACSSGSPAAPVRGVAVLDAFDAGTGTGSPVIPPIDAGGGGCPAGFHDCDGTCSDDTNPATCGTSCTPCLVGEWAEPRCDGMRCQMTCFPFHADCDHEPGNGCESLLTADANNCGFCGNACAGASCNDGMCAGTQ